MTRNRRSKGSSKIRRNVARCPTSRKRESQHPSCELLRPMRRLQRHATLDLPQSPEQIRRDQFSDRLLPNLRNQKRVEHPPHLEQGGGSERPVLDVWLLLQGQPFLRHRSERVLTRRLRQLPMLTRVNTVRDHPPSRIATLARYFERHIGIHAQADATLAPMKSVLEPPPPRSIRIHQEIKTATVEQLQRLLDCGRRSNLRLCQHSHDPSGIEPVCGGSGELPLSWLPRIV